MWFFCALRLHRWGPTGRMDLPEVFEGDLWMKQCVWCGWTKAWSDELIIMPTRK